jgi:frataxin-like iron-binding protein CyaY
MNTILKDDKKLEVETESQMGATQGTENIDEKIDYIVEMINDSREIMDIHLKLLNEKKLYTKLKQDACYEIKKMNKVMTIEIENLEKYLMEKRKNN